MTWEDFIIFLKNIFETLVHCQQTVATFYKKVYQKPYQTGADFVMYLNRLKDKLSPYDDKAYFYHLKTKLYREIANKIIACSNFLRTCQEAIDLAICLEQTKPICKPKRTLLY